MINNPISATYSGNHTLNNRMPSVSNEQIEQNLKFWKSILSRLEEIQLNSLSKKNRVNHKIFFRIINSRIKSIEYKDYYMPFNADSGFHTGLARLYKAMPFETVEDYEIYISRLLDFPRYFEEQIANMNMGLNTGISIPKVVLKGYEVTIKTHVVDLAEESAFFEPFRSFPNSFSTKQKSEIKEKGRLAVMNGAVKAYASFLDFFLNQYYPNARMTLGASELPGGMDYYNFKIDYFTTLNLSCDEVKKKIRWLIYYATQTYRPVLNISTLLLNYTVAKMDVQEEICKVYHTNISKIINTFLYPSEIYVL